MLLIPDENRLVLQTLILFLNEIAKHHKTNQVIKISKNFQNLFGIFLKKNHFSEKLEFIFSSFE